MTVKLPSVSTTGRDLMIALWYAILEVPIASTMVTRAGNPLGIMETAMATHDLKDSTAVSLA